MDVKLLQLKLMDHGLLKADDVDGILGRNTVAAVKKFQAAKGLEPDGKVGKDTMAKLGMVVYDRQKWDIQPLPENQGIGSLRTRATAVAISQDGVKERGNNSGPAVNAFLASVGLNPGYSWCMAFVYWCFGQAADSLGVKNPLVRTGGCMRQWNETRCYKTTNDPQTGDIFIMDLGGGAGHTGIVVAVERDVIHTIEGNTNNNGSANGDGVYTRIRQRNRIKGYIRC